MGKVSHVLHEVDTMLTIPLANPSTSFTFPSTESAGATPSVPAPSPQRRKPLLSFRRISLPTAPTLLNRQSSASLTSYDSFPEETAAGAGPVEPTPAHRNAGNKLINRPFVADGNKRIRKRRDSTRPQDEGKAVKRRKIIVEFYETERAYVDGLDLIYSVCLVSFSYSVSTDTGP